MKNNNEMDAIEHEEFKAMIKRLEGELAAEKEAQARRQGAELALTVEVMHGGKAARQILQSFLKAELVGTLAVLNQCLNSLTEFGQISDESRTGRAIRAADKEITRLKALMGDIV